MCLLFCQSLKDEPQVQNSGKYIYVVPYARQVCGPVTHNLYAFVEEEVHVEADDDNAHDPSNQLFFVTKAIDSCACEDGVEAYRKSEID